MINSQVEPPLEALLGSLWRWLQESLHGGMGTRGTCLGTFRLGARAAMDGTLFVVVEQPGKVIADHFGLRSLWTPMKSPSIPSNIRTMVEALFVIHNQPVPPGLPSNAAISLATVYRYKYITCTHSCELGESQRLHQHCDLQHLSHRLLFGQPA